MLSQQCPEKETDHDLFFNNGGGGGRFFYDYYDRDRLRFPGRSIDGLIEPYIPPA